MKTLTQAIDAPRSVTWMGTSYQIKVHSAESAGTMGLFESVVPVGDGPPVHVHHNEDEVIYVIEGTFEFWLDGETFIAAAGSAVFLPRGVPHTFRVVGSMRGRSLAVLTPGGFEQFFLDATKQGLTSAEQMAGVIELATRYGLEFRGAAPWAEAA